MIRMRKAKAVLGSLVFLLVAPGTVVGLLPWWISHWRPGPSVPAQGLLTAVGWVLIVVGVATLLHSFLRFIVEGIGTPAPVAETENLVVGGLYRFVRNPMYVAVDMAILGQAAVLRSTSLLIYWVVVSLGQAAFVHFYEEPRLLARYGESYADYRRSVPAWFPRWGRRERSAADEGAS